MAPSTFPVLPRNSPHSVCPSLASSRATLSLLAIAADRIFLLPMAAVDALRAL
eukprot:CAMPEP_0169469358 /NCGR_PEP_ID=MMETSP1042-20121227/23435_1 /TAXON_ID=464988 /ORGANISM="Hemiselmis andersenii, Strain CCMP1180" /LENGTH=52 /DNA_ID=CAMNT_0009582825 /DNA_START=306 /DNA_END=464 /DNA_ORIENTATION=-